MSRSRAIASQNFRHIQLFEFNLTLSYVIEVRAVVGSATAHRRDQGRDAYLTP